MGGIDEIECDISQFKGNVMDNNENNLDELIHYYGVKMNGLSSYSSIVWNRFNWILTLELAAFGLFLTKEKASISDSISIDEFCVVGIVITTLWIVMGLLDYRSLDRHKESTKYLEKKVRMKLKEPVHDNDGHSLFRQTWILFLFPMMVILIWIYLFIN